MRASLIKDGVVVNVIGLPDDWTGAKGEWERPPNHKVVIGGGDLGDLYDGTNFTKPPAPPIPPRTAAQKLKILRREASEEILAEATGPKAIEYKLAKAEI